jgi:hypothetical protein
MSEEQAAVTRFCARVAGPFLIIAGLLIFTRYDTFPMLLPSVLQNAPLVLITGIWTLILGLIMFAAHHHLGSPAAVTLTVIALVLVLRGALLMLLPETLITVAAQMVRVPAMMWATTALMLAVGLWLAFVGWFARNV